MTSELTNALNRILTWLQQNKSYYVDYLGLAEKVYKTHLKPNDTRI